ncbi:MAG: galactose-1-phosphate uridylyltransferase [Candidatus Omnitrophica bacterium]|nr:galactose-1-phosphate uridylyltransferase [Candidatus Omnitrophota bacterium]
MPQIRKDFIVNRWVIVATERGRRQAAFVSPVNQQTDPHDCPFCQPIADTPLLANDRVRVFKSGTPFFVDGKPFSRQRHGLYEVSSSWGSHEVVLETTDHVANMSDLALEDIQKVFETYAQRMRLHRQDPSIRYVLAYKNYGVAAGSRPIGHARSQIMAIPVNPVRVKDKISGAKRYFDFHERCLFCDLIDQERKDGQRLILENGEFLALMPFASRFPFEVWIVPKRHCCDFAQGITGYEGQLAQIIKELLLRFKVGLNDPAYNYLIQSAPFEDGGGYKEYPTIEEDYHWHIELLPRLMRVAGFERGTGFYINPIPPEMTAEFLREVKI